MGKWGQGKGQRGGNPRVKKRDREEALEEGVKRRGGVGEIT